MDKLLKEALAAIERLSSEFSPTPERAASGRGGLRNSSGIYNLIPQPEMVAGIIFSAGGNIVKEFGIVLDGKIIGQGLHVNCKVQATKTTLNGDPPAFSDFHLLNSDETDELPDGDYKVLVNNRQVHLKRKGGHFLGRV